MPTLQSINASASPEVQANENFEAMSPAGLFGIKRPTTSGLTLGVYGGIFWDGSAYVALSDVTVALTASQTNYVEATAAGVVSANTVGFTAGRIRLFIITTTASGINAVTDYRTYFLQGGNLDLGSLTLTDLTIATGTITASAPGYSLSQTWNNAGVTFIGAETNITDTASAAASVVERWRVGGTDVMSLRKDGLLTVPSLTVSTGALTVAGQISSAVPLGTGPGLKLDPGASVNDGVMMQLVARSNGAGTRRTWRFATDLLAAGDFWIGQSTAEAGSSFTNLLGLTATGATLAGTLTVAGYVHLGTAASWDTGLGTIVDIGPAGSGSLWGNAAESFALGDNWYYNGGYKYKGVGTAIRVAMDINGFSISTAPTAGSGAGNAATFTNQFVVSVAGTITVSSTTINMTTSGTTLTVGVGADNGTVSAGVFTDRTAAFTGDAMLEIRKIRALDGEIDHDSLPAFCRHSVRRTSRDELGNETETIAVERNIGATVSMLTSGMQQIDARLTALEAR